MKRPAIDERLSTESIPFDTLRESILRELRSSMPGEIVDFDPATQTATVQPLIRDYQEGDKGTEYVPLPLLQDVPVLCPGGGGYAITFPVKAGDECMLFIADRCMDAWFQSGGMQNPVVMCAHDISDAVAIVGFRSRPKALTAYNTEKPEMNGDPSLWGGKVQRVNGIAPDAEGNVALEADDIPTGAGNVQREITSLKSAVDALPNRNAIAQMISTAILESKKASLPVGTIWMSTSSANPATYMGFGTWATWGAGRVPVGVGSNGTTNYTGADATGGGETHGHSIASHSHTMAHSHTVNSHTHTMAHTHSVASHSHTTPSLVLQASHLPYLSGNFQVHGGESSYSSLHSPAGIFAGSNYAGYGRAARQSTTASASTHIMSVAFGGNVAHGHGNTGGTALTTGGSSAANTGGASPATGGSSAANTGGTATSTAAGDSRQPYVTCYMWKRTA